MEEIIFEDSEIPEEYVGEVAKALLMRDPESALCELVERMHHRVPDTAKFFNTAGTVVMNLSEKKYYSFREKIKQELERPDLPARVQMFYRCLL